MDIMDSYYHNMIDAEIRLAQRNPIFEAEYILNDDPRMPLRLYDCLIPQIKSQLKSRKSYEGIHKV